MQSYHEFANTDNTDVEEVDTTSEKETPVDKTAVEVDDLNEV